MLPRFLFGRDFFISYSRRDAAAYAAKLASQLGVRYSCYLDQLATPRGEKLPAPIQRELRRATVCVLIGSPGALRSVYVQHELELFLETGRPVLLVDAAGGLEGAPLNAPPWSYLTGVYRQPESREALVRAEPSPEVLAYLRDSFTFTRQDRRLRLASGGAATLIGAVTIGAGVISAVTRRRAAEAARRAEQARAEEAIARADAQEQQRIAASRRLANESSSRLGPQPDLALLLAAHAHQTSPTVEARRALLSGLARYPGLLRIVRDPSLPDIVAMTTSADGNVVATGTHDLITVWDPTTMQPLRTIEEPGENLRALALTPDGAILAAARSQHVTLVETATGHPIGRIEAGTSALAFASAARLAIGFEDALEIWDVSTPDASRKESTMAVKRVEALAADPSGLYLAIRSYDQLIVCDPASCESTRRVLTGENDLLFLSVASGGTPALPLLAAASAAGQLVMWNAMTGERLVDVPTSSDLEGSVAHSGGGRDLYVVAVSRDGRWVAVGSARGRLTLASIQGLASWSRAAALGAENRGRLDAELALFGSNPFGIRRLTYAPGAAAMTFAGEDSRLLIAQADGGLSVWNTDVSSAIEDVRQWPGERIYHAVHAFSADGRHVAYSDGRDGVFLWDVRSADPPLRLPTVFENGPREMAVSADSERVIAMESAMGPNPWRTLAVWDAAGRLLSATLVDEAVVPVEPNTLPKQMLIGAPGGRLAAVLFVDGTVAAWDLSDPEPRLRGACRSSGWQIAVNPAAPEIAIVDRRGSVSLWDPAEDRLEPLPGTADDVMALGYSDDGRTLLAFTSSDGSGWLHGWDLPTRRARASWLVFELGASAPGVADVTDPRFAAISADGRLLALGNSRAVDLWDVAARGLLTALTLPADVESLAFDSEGSLLAGHDDGVSRVEVSAPRLVARARETAGRPLNAAEIQRYFDGAAPPL